MIYVAEYHYYEHLPENISEHFYERLCRATPPWQRAPRPGRGVRKGAHEGCLGGVRSGARIKVLFLASLGHPVLGVRAKPALAL